MIAASDTAAETPAGRQANDEESLTPRDSQGDQYGADASDPGAAQNAAGIESDPGSRGPPAGYGDSYSPPEGNTSPHRPGKGTSLGSGRITGPGGGVTLPASPWKRPSDWLCWVR